MPDDIVTRLRELAIGSLYGISIAPFEHYNAAADEIEYLRSEMANVNSEYNKLWHKYERALKDNGTDTPMSEGGKAMIVSVLGHAPCVCDSLRMYGVDGMCTRCMALDYTRKHWPWWYYKTIGNMGANNES